MTSASSSRDTGTSSVDDADIARFDQLAAQWWDVAGAMKPLHQFTPVRIDLSRIVSGGQACQICATPPCACQG